MNPDRWNRVKALHAHARDLAPKDRGPYLDGACEGDHALKAEVERLFLSDSNVGAFLEPPLRKDLPCFALVGKVIEGCEILTEIGRGSGGIVYLARQPRLDRKIAFKVLAPYWGLFGDKLERFRREAKAESRLRHPHIVSVLFSGEAEGMPYLAMEYVEGHSLKQHLDAARSRRDGEALENQPWVLEIENPVVCALLISKVASALRHCHEQGIIHRDIKPSNILIDEHGEPRVADFGLARDDSLDELTGSGMIGGTLHYMSPEQARAKQADVDHRTDIYSTGAVLYELLTLQPPFPGLDPPEVLRQICYEPATPIQKLNPKAPRGLSRICQRALEKDAELRYASAAELEADLQRYLQGKRVFARGLSAKHWIGQRLRAHPRAVAAGICLVVGVVMSITQFPRTVDAGKDGRASGTDSPASAAAALPTAGTERTIASLRDEQDSLIKYIDSLQREKDLRENKGRHNEEPDSEAKPR